MTRRADDLAEEARTLPRGEQLHLVELVVHDLADQKEEPSAPSSLIGCFADQAELMDEIAAGFDGSSGTRSAERPWSTQIFCPTQSP